MKEYRGKKVFVGIDVHKKSYSGSGSICEGVVVKRDRLPASPEGLENYIRKYFPGGQIHSVYEAGFSGFVLHRYLISQGINNIVVHAGSIEVSSRDRVKTDKRDALKMATQLSAGRLRGIHVPDIERESARRISRLREKLVGDRKRVGNRIKSLLHILGKVMPEDERKVSARWLTEMSRCGMDESTRYVYEVYKKQWLSLSEQIKGVEKRLAEQAKEDELEEVYRSAPGVGASHARVLAHELGDMKHFNNEKRLYSHTGLTAGEYSSGEHQRQGHISRQGNSLLRKVLVQAAWIAIGKDASLRAVYDRIAKRAGAKRAIIGVARRLIGRIRACFMSGQLYQMA